MIELVERNLAQLCEEAPIMSAPVTKEIPSERKTRRRFPVRSL